MGSCAVASLDGVHSVRHDGAWIEILTIGKLGARNRTGAARLARQKGWL